MVRKKCVVLHTQKVSYNHYDLMDINELDDSNLLEKPLWQLKHMLETIDEIKGKGQEDTIEPLHYALKRVYVFKYNEIKRVLLLSLIQEIEKRALEAIIETCNKKIVELEAEKIPNTQALLEFFDKLDIEFVETNSKKVKDTKLQTEQKSSPQAILYVINKIFLNYLEEASAKINEVKEHIGKIQEQIETYITTKTYLGAYTIVPVKKKQMIITPLVKISELPDDVKEKVTYDKLNIAKAKQWINAHPEQILFSVKEKEYHLRVLDNTLK